MVCRSSMVSLVKYGVSKLNGLTGEQHAVSKFNGATGEVHGVSKLNGLTGEQHAISKFNGVTGEVHGVSKLNGSTGELHAVTTLNGISGTVESIRKNTALFNLQSSSAITASDQHFFAAHVVPYGCRGELFGVVGSTGGFKVSLMKAAATEFGKTFGAVSSRCCSDNHRKLRSKYKTWCNSSDIYVNSRNRCK